METAPDKRQRIFRYLRLIAAACLIGIAFGYYLELLGDIDMNGWRTFEFAVRGGIVGAFFWGVELFVLGGRMRASFQARSYSRRLIARIVVYAVVIEAGLFVGQLIFAPHDPFGLLPILRIN